MLSTQIPLPPSIIYGPICFKLIFLSLCSQEAKKKSEGNSHILHYAATEFI